MFHCCSLYHSEHQSLYMSGVLFICLYVYCYLLLVIVVYNHVLLFFFSLKRTLLSALCVWMTQNWSFAWRTLCPEQVWTGTGSTASPGRWQGAGLHPPALRWDFLSSADADFKDQTKVHQVRCWFSAGIVFLFKHKTICGSHHLKH